MAQTTTATARPRTGDVKVHLQVLSVKVSWKSSDVFDSEKSLTAQCVIQPLVFVTPTTTKRYELYQGSPKTCFLGESAMRWRSGFPRWKNNAAFDYMKLTIWKICERREKPAPLAAKAAASSPAAAATPLAKELLEARGVLIGQATVDLTKQTGVSDSGAAKFTYRFRLWDSSRRSEVGHVVISWRHVNADAAKKDKPVSSESASKVRQPARKSMPASMSKTPKHSRRFGGITGFFRRTPTASSPPPRRHSLSDTHSFRIENSSLGVRAQSPTIGAGAGAGGSGSGTAQAPRTLDSATRRRKPRGSRADAILRVVTRRTRTKVFPGAGGAAGSSSSSSLSSLHSKSKPKQKHTPKDDVSFSVSVSGECRTATILGDSTSKLSVNSLSTTSGEVGKRRRSTPNILTSWRRRKTPKAAKPRATTPRALTSYPRGRGTSSSAKPRAMTPRFSLSRDSVSRSPRALTPRAGGRNRAPSYSMQSNLYEISPSTKSNEDMPALTVVTRTSIDEPRPDSAAISHVRLLTPTTSSASTRRPSRRLVQSDTEMDAVRRKAKTPPPPRLALPSANGGDDRLRRVMTAERPGAKSRPQRAETFSFMDMINSEKRTEATDSAAARIPASAPRPTRRLSATPSAEAADALRWSSKTPPASMRGASGSGGGGRTRLGLPSANGAKGDDHLRRVMTAEPPSSNRSRPRADTFSFMDMMNYEADSSDEEEEKEAGGAKIGTFAAMRLVRKHTAQLKEYLGDAAKAKATHASSSSSSSRSPRVGSAPEQRSRFAMLNLSKLQLSPKPKQPPRGSKKQTRGVPLKSAHVKLAESHLRNEATVERELRPQAAARLRELDSVEAQIRGLALR